MEYQFKILFASCFVLIFVCVSHTLFILKSWVLLVGQYQVLLGQNQFQLGQIALTVSVSHDQNRGS